MLMNCRLTVLMILLLLSQGVIAQRDEGNSRPGQADTTKVNILVQQILTLRETDPDRAVHLCLEAISLARQLGYQKGIGRATESLGWIYFRRGDFVKALDYSIEALKISEKIGDDAETARCLNNMAAIYNEEKQFDESLENLKKALGLAVNTGDFKTTARSLNNTALLYLQAWNNLDSAEVYARRGLEISEKIKDDYNGAFSNRILGDIAAGREKHREALKYYFRSLSMSDGVSNSLKVETWNRIAEAYLHERRFPEATSVLMKNIETTRKYSYREALARSYHLLSDVYASQKNAPAALVYLGRYTALHDSIYNDQTGMQLATLQSQFNLDLKQAEIELLTKDTELHKKEISRQQIQLYASAGGLVGILLIAALLFYVNRKVYQANILLEHQRDELGIKNREVELKSKELEMQANQLALLNSTKDKLFSIIGHDFRSPLNSLKGILALVQNKDLTQEQFAATAGILKSNLDSVSTTLENLLQWSLAQIQGIQTNPVKVNIQSLVEEHLALFNEVAKEKDIRLENEIGQNLFAISDENHLRLVLRNLINNAIKFTPSGGMVKISSLRESPFIKILVSDTGIGIAPQQLRNFLLKEKVLSTEGTNREKGMGIGLMLCQEFVENNGGQLTVASEPGKGSVFSFTLKAA